MKTNKFLAVTLAGTMMAGTLATAVPVLAEDYTTKVTLNVPTWNTYTLNVPTETALNVDGTAVELTNGIKVSDGTLVDGKKVTVTATSKGEWTMSSSAATTTFNYGLYATTDATATTTSWDFTQEEANTASKDAKAKTVYAKADTDTLYEAAAGTYSDVITFTAKVAEVPKPQIMFNLTGRVEWQEGYSTEEGTTWSELAAQRSDLFSIDKTNNIVLYMNDYEIDGVTPDDKIEDLKTYSVKSILG